MKQTDFTFDVWAEGYMLKYKGQNIGGASILGKYRGKRRQKQIAENAACARLEVEALQAGNGQKRFLDAIAQIDKDNTQTATATESSKGPIQVFNDRELATVLHALRILQESRNPTQRLLGGCYDAEQRSHAGMETNTSCDHFEEASPLTDDEIDALCERLNLAPETATKVEVVVEVSDGVATVSDCPDSIDVRIVDWDMFAQGDHTLIGENAVTEEYRAWLEKNRPEWYEEELKQEGKDTEWQAAQSKRTADFPANVAAGIIPHDPQDDGKAVWEKDHPPLSADVIAARAGILPHDPQDDEPEHEECSEDGCTERVYPEDPYFSSPCGTYCTEHMRLHVKVCEICRNEFPAATTETQHPRHGQFENMNEDEANMESAGRIIDETKRQMERIKAELPADPEGQNDDRAKWAQAAIDVFQTVTGTDDGDRLADLLGDLMHWCDRNGMGFAHELERAHRYYEEETKPEPEERGHRNNPDFCAKCGGTCRYDSDGNLKPTHGAAV